MNTFYWLIKREFWEHRGGFLWAPIISAGIVVILNILIVIVGEAIGGGHDNFNLMWDQLATASPGDLHDVSAILDFSALMPGIIASIALFFVLFSYCMKNLSRDRSDRSILFWKSLPVSDLSTVLSKVFCAVIVAPVITVIVSVIGAMLMLLILALAAAMHGIAFGMVMWGLPHPAHIVVSLFGLLPVYMVWMLPAVGWLMLCSAWTRGRAARWAMGLPFGLGGVLLWLTAMVGHASAGGWYMTHIAFRIAFSVFPGSWMIFADEQDLPLVRWQSGDSLQVHGLSGLFNQTLAAQYQLLLTPEFLWGVLAGAVMIAMAVWLRRWRTEL